ncbi:MAG: lptB 5 [Rhodospirillales bacterium]|jgi:branched-chain amino acid transport system ATP-binding protein|nr:lptB 5 [Rhodospirillales bacterium]
MSEAAALTVDDISLAFGGHRVLNDVTMAFRPGEVTGLIGPNGAGKTSLFNCLTGFYQPSSGTIALGDLRLDRMPPRRGRASACRAASSMWRCVPT